MPGTHNAFHADWIRLAACRTLPAQPLKRWTVRNRKEAGHMPDWKSLKHAYGTAEDMPELLAALRSFPDESSYENEPWFSLWSSLYHQGDIYSASLAAVPEIVKCLAASPEKATASFFALPASIEVARKQKEINEPAALMPGYFQAIRRLGDLAYRRVCAEANDGIARAALAAFAVSASLHSYAELILEIPSDEIPEVMEWFWER